jgi:hypothetical protein
MLSNVENNQDSSIVNKMKNFWELKSKLDAGATKSSMKNTLSSYSGHDEVINCAVKAVTIQKHTIHQIELFCTCCSSTFIVRAAHACERDNAEDGKEEETGLEWLNSTNGDQINLTI